ncbi:MAG: cysteine desulfurase [Rickettsiales bacterium]|jgi:cysteine desulfurase/selenocysteine lyase|nr:cysteine desulfurase [Rickettsiales bacterium]
MKATTISNAIYDVEKIRADFPVLAQNVYGKKLAFLDSAASSQKPQCVIDAVAELYSKEYANIHRGVYYLSQQSTKKFEDVREAVRRFINARNAKEIIFVRGGTEAINLVASSYGRAFLQAGDEVIISEMEHHANIVPWQVLRDQLGITLRVVPFNDQGELQLGVYESYLSERTKFVAVTHVSNALGTLNPIEEIIQKAHSVGAKVLIDACQSIPHMKLDVQALDADFIAFSSHKMYGPTGIGVLYGKAELLESMPPYQTGGEMIRYVTFEKTEYADLPHKFEAGTPAIAEAVGLGEAVRYLETLGLENIEAHDAAILNYAENALKTIPGLRFIGQAKQRVGLIAFTLDGVHPHDAGTILDREGVAVRVGHHCAFPVMQHFNIPATIRASFGIYTTKADVDALIAALHKVRELLG